MRFFLERLKLFLIVLGMVLVNLPNSFSQKNNTGTQKAIEDFKGSFSAQSRLFNGAAYLGYDGVLEGSPFLDDNASFNKGNLVYDGVYYENVPIQYDLALGKLISYLPDSYTKYALNNEMLSEFSIGDRKFINILEGGSEGETAKETGIFEEVYRGSSKVLIKRMKTYQKIIDTYGIRLKFSERTRYFLLIGGNYFRVDSESMLLKAFQDRSADIKKFLRQSRLKFKVNPREVLIKSASFYDSFPQ